jgi:hypothetical protein
MIENWVFGRRLLFLLHLIWHTLHTHIQSGTCTRSTPCRRALTLSTSAKRICRARDSTTTSASTANCARASAAISKSSFIFLTAYIYEKTITIFFFFISTLIHRNSRCLAPFLCNLDHLLHYDRWWLFFLRRETCYNAWRGLRMTPLFGCFCPGNDQKKCERIYSFIYNNTCVGKFNSFYFDLIWFETFLGLFIYFTI